MTFPDSAPTAAPDGSDEDVDPIAELVTIARAVNGLASSKPLLETAGPVKFVRLPLSLLARLDVLLTIFEERATAHQAAQPASEVADVLVATGQG
jgi:hypothetical protein